MIRNFLIGTNSFTECEAPLGYQERAILGFDSKEDGRLFANLWIPAPPARIPIEVDGGEAKDGHSVVHSEVGRAEVALGALVLLQGQLITPDTVLVNVFDLRPVGLMIFATPTALQVGNGYFSQNSIVGARIGIAIG